MSTGSDADKEALFAIVYAAMEAPETFTGEDVFNVLKTLGHTKIIDEVQMFRSEDSDPEADIFEDTEAGDDISVDEWIDSLGE